MKSHFLDKILLSLVIAVGLLVIVNVIGELAIRPQMAPPVLKAKDAVAAKPATPAPEAVKAASQVGDITSLLAAYDPQAGKKAFRKCKSCHTSDKDGKNRVGPNLWNVVGRDKGSMEGFNYSEAMKQKGGTWTFAELDAFLKSPKTFVVGTRMSIKDYKDPLQRAALIGYLRALSESPKALVD